MSRGDEARDPRRRLLGVYVGDLSDYGRYAAALVGRKAPFGREFFEAKYERPDPFGYEGSGYDELKRNMVRYGLGGRRYRRLLDVGSGEGFLAAHVADRAERVDLLDCAAAAVARARARVRLAGEDLVGDAVEVLAALEAGSRDAIVVSEVLYYVALSPLAGYGRSLRDQLVRVLEPGGRLVLIHPVPWLLHRPYRRDRRLRLAARASLQTFRSVELVAFDRLAG